MRCTDRYTVRACMCMDASLCMRPRCTQACAWFPISIIQHYASSIHMEHSSIAAQDKLLLRPLVMLLSPILQRRSRTKPFLPVSKRGQGAAGWTVQYKTRSLLLDRQCMEPYNTSRAVDASIGLLHNISQMRLLTYTLQEYVCNQNYSDEATTCVKLVVHNPITEGMLHNIAQDCKAILAQGARRAERMQRKIGTDFRKKAVPIGPSYDRTQIEISKGRYPNPDG